MAGSARIVILQGTNVVIEENADMLITATSIAPTIAVSFFLDILIFSPFSFALTRKEKWGSLDFCSV
jgi:hypothetical protein